MRFVSACVYAMLWYDTSVAADARFLATTLCKYARVYRWHTLQLHDGSIGLRREGEGFRGWSEVGSLGSGFGAHGKE